MGDLSAAFNNKIVQIIQSKPHLISTLRSIFFIQDYYVNNLLFCNHIDIALSYSLIQLFLYCTIININNNNKNNNNAYCSFISCAHIAISINLLIINFQSIIASSNLKEIIILLFFVLHLRSKNRILEESDIPRNS